MTKTVIGLFDNTRAAGKAVLELVNSGIPREDIGITSQDYMAGERTGYDSSAETDAGDKHKGIGEKSSNFFSSLFGGDDANDVGYYSDAVRRGSVVVTVDAETDDAALPMWMSVARSLKQAAMLAQARETSKRNQLIWLKEARLQFL